MSALPCRRRSLAGFTLIELLIVIVIIGILVAIAVPAYLRYEASANDRDAQAALQTAYKAAVAGDTEVNSSRFPAASTVVNDVKADEPAANVVRGDCYGTVANAPVKQVLVDPSSTSTQITMCVKSASGAIWKLTGPLTGTPTVSDGSTVALTMTGNEITDAYRASGQGDGLTNDSSTGVWSGTTNLLTNSNFETAVTPTWFAAGGGTATASVDSTTSVFGSASAKVVTGGDAPGQGLDSGNALGNGIPVSANTSYTFSAWVKAPAGPSVQLEIGYYTSGTFQSNTVGAGVAMSGNWQRLTLTGTTPAGTNGIIVRVRFVGTVASTLWIDGAQLEQQYVATPYTPTSRGSGSIQAPASLLNINQAWVAVRVRLDWPSAMPPRGGAGWDWVFRWGAPGSPRNSIDLLYREFGSGAPCWSAENWVADTDTGGMCTAPITVQPGDYFTLVLYWKANAVGLSMNGGAFSTTGRTVQSAATMPSTYAIGGSNAGSSIDGDIMWFACGTGTLTNADASTINSWGNTDPSRASFPTAAQTTMVWNGSSAAGSLK